MPDDGYGSSQYGQGSFGGASGYTPTREEVGWSNPFTYPKAPVNGIVASPFKRGMLDIRWDNPAILAANSLYGVVGVNIYRSDVSERGPYFRVNPYPISSGFYRDFTDHRLVTEVIPWDGGWIWRGSEGNRISWKLQTEKAIVKPDPTDCILGNAPYDVVLSIDGQVCPVERVFGRTGEITLMTRSYYDHATDTVLPPTLPTENSLVQVSYYTNENYVKHVHLDQKVFYRLSTVAVDSTSPSGLIESPLDVCPPLTPYRVEEMDWIWRPAVHRNNWILEQGGERVKLFLRKTSGLLCSCGFDPETREYNKQPNSRCYQCFGVGFVGGYEGPWEAIMAPDDAERRVTQKAYGRSLEHTYEVWMGPTPLLTQRDFVVKQTNERYSVGGVRKPSNRGNILQQHFNIRYLNENDIRYHVPIDGTDNLPWPEARVSIDSQEELIRFPKAEYGPIQPMAPNDPSEHDPQIYPTAPHREQATPMATDKKNPCISDTREHRGRTQTWENQNYGILLFPFALWMLKLLFGASSLGLIG